MKIFVPEPFIGKFDEPESLRDVAQIIEDKTPAITRLATAAFVDKDQLAWLNVQRLLYLWNVEELERTTSPVVDLSRTVRQGLRNAILRVEHRQDLSSVMLSGGGTADPERLLLELRERALSHRINTHPLLESMAENGLSKAALKLFLENYYVNNRVFHLHIAAQSLSSPLQMRTDMYKNLFDELGQGDATLAHPVLFLRNFAGLPPAGMFEPLAGALYLLNTKIYHTFLSGRFRQGLGALGFLEFAMPAQMEKLYAGILKAGVSKHNAHFWELHISLDKEHGHTWVADMLPYIADERDALEMLVGGLGVLDARAMFYDDVLAAISDSPQPHVIPRRSAAPGPRNPSLEMLRDPRARHYWPRRSRPWSVMLATWWSRPAS